jgi:hypothetical protein
LAKNGAKDPTDTNTDFSPFSLLSTENTGIRNHKRRILLLTYTVSETPFTYGIVLKFQYRVHSFTKTIYKYVVIELARKTTRACPMDVSASLKGSL